MTDRTRGILYLFIAVVLYSIMPILIRYLGRGMIPPASQVFLRYIVAFVLASAYASKKIFRFQYSTSIVQQLAMLGVFGYALVNYFYTLANLNTQISTVLFLFNCATVMGPLLGYFFLAEPLNYKKIVAMGIGLVSLFLLFQPGSMESWRTGAIFSVISAVGSSYYMIGRKKLGTVDTAVILFFNTLMGVLVMGSIALLGETQFFLHGYRSVSEATWLATMLFGLDNFLAYLLMTRGYQLVSAGTGSMVMLTENFIGVVLAFLFFSELPSLATIGGGLLIIVASFLVVFEKPEKARR